MTPSQSTDDLVKRGELVEVPPLKSGRGIEAHMDSAHVHTLHSHQYVVIDRPICDYEQARALRDWLNKALGDKP